MLQEFPDDRERERDELDEASHPFWSLWLVNVSGDTMLKMNPVVRWLKGKTGKGAYATGRDHQATGRFAQAWSRLQTLSAGCARLTAPIISGQFKPPSSAPGVLFISVTSTKPFQFWNMQ